VGKRGGIDTSKENLLFWAASIVSFFLVIGQSNWLMQKKKTELGRHLI
jgi:hypothetical protein